MGTGRQPDSNEGRSLLGRFAIIHRGAIVFVTMALCLGSGYCAFHIASSVFPRTDFPRVVILVDNGVTPADEMMATITRPIEEAMKDIPGVTTIRSAPGRGSAEVNVFFNWQVDIVQSQLYVLGRLAQTRPTLPDTATTQVYRLTFSAFPIIGVSLTSDTRDITPLWETARYELKPRFLRIPGVARVDLVGGRSTEYHVIVDLLRLQACGPTLSDVTDAFKQNNLIASAGMHQENHLLYLTVVDGRLRDLEAIADFPVKVVDGHPICVRDFARVVRGPEPVFNIVTADGKEAVLLNIRSQPGGSTLEIAKRLRWQIETLRRQLPSDMKLAFFYDQSLFVRESVRGVWQAILFGLILSVAVLYLFLKNWGSTIVATLVIPMTVLMTLVAMKLTGLTFNMMTLGGIAAAVGVIIDNAIVVVEAIHTKLGSGVSRPAAVESAVGELFGPLVASTLTPVVVFIPLAFLTGITGVFFRALAMSMVFALLTSLVLAVTVIQSLAVWWMSVRMDPAIREWSMEGGAVLRLLIRMYEASIRVVLRHRWITLGGCLLILLASLQFYRRLDRDFLPPMDEGGFVIDYQGPPGTSLAETAQMLRQAEAILQTVPEIASYSRGLVHVWPWRSQSRTRAISL
jgi:multidrug efflux pump subunit AcrB